MAEKDLYRPYFYTEEGEKDEIAFGIPSHTDRIAYVILKNDFKDIDSDLFFDDLTMCIKQDLDGNISDIWMHTMELSREFYSLNEISETNADAYLVMEKLLSQGKNVFVKTFCPALKFSKLYNPEVKPEGFLPVHGFFVIWHDEYNIYYIECPDLLKYKHFVPFEGNREVGVLTKKEFKEVASYCLKCYTLEISKDKLHKLKECFVKAISQSIENYHDKHFILKDCVISCGREAILRLIDICDKESFCLDAMAPHNRNFSHYFDWKIAGVIKRRKFVLSGFERHAKLENKSFYVDACEAIGDAIYAWTKCSQSISKQYLKKRFVLGQELKEEFIDVLKKEDNLNDNLKKLVAELV